jgi:ferredoxin-fold anticodon binding domain-containing protein
MNWYIHIDNKCTHNHKILCKKCNMNEKTIFKFKKIQLLKKMLLNKWNKKKLIKILDYWDQW